MTNQRKCLVNGRYQIALPGNSLTPNFDDNRFLAETKLHCLQKKIWQKCRIENKYETVI